MVKCQFLCCVLFAVLSQQTIHWRWPFLYCWSLVGVRAGKNRICHLDAITKTYRETHLYIHNSSIHILWTIFHTPFLNCMASHPLKSFATLNYLPSCLYTQQKTDHRTSSVFIPVAAYFHKVSLFQLCHVNIAPDASNHQLSLKLSDSGRCCWLSVWTTFYTFGHPPWDSAGSRLKLCSVLMGSWRDGAAALSVWGRGLPLMGPLRNELVLMKWHY